MNSRKRIAIAAIAATGLVAPFGLTMEAAHADSDAGYIIGKVIGATGQAVPGAEVDVFWCEQDPTGTADPATGCTDDYDYRSGYTDRNGRYVVPMYKQTLADVTQPGGLPGHWAAYASASNFADSTVQAVAPVTGQNIGGPTFQLSPTPYTEDLTGIVLTGVVTTPSGVAQSGSVAAYDAVTGRYLTGAQVESNGHFYFDGSSSSTQDWNLAGRSVKLEFYVAGYTSTFNGGGWAKATAPTINVPASGQTPAAVSGAVTMQGTITGAVKLPAAGANWEAGVTVYDADGVYVTDGGTDAAGNFSVDVDPGSYYVRADGARFTEYTPVGQTVPQQADTFGFVAGYYGKNATSLATASKITVGANGNVSVGTITLTNALHATDKPVIKGKKGVTSGSRLSVGTGTWNRQADVTYAYAWKVGSKTVGTGSSLKISKKIWKKSLKNGKKATKLSVTVTATDKFGELVSGSVTQKVEKTLTKQAKQLAKDAKKAQKKADKAKQ